MPTANPQPFFAVDIGNSRIKVGRFDDAPLRHPSSRSAALPEPIDAMSFSAEALQSDEELAQALAAWLDGLAAAQRDQRSRLCGDATWWVSSVNWPLAASFSSAVKRVGAGSVHKLSAADLPLEVRLDEPDRVGIDRLLAAVAANRLRSPERPAVVVDLGSAITVDLVAADGVFEGGAILPGIAMAARALADQTDALPRSPIAELTTPPPPIGTSTLAAIESGLFWGAIGAVRELARQYEAQGRARGVSPAKLPPTALQDRPQLRPAHTDRSPDDRSPGGRSPGDVPELFLTGGAAPPVAELLSRDGQPARLIPHLVLSGIAVAAEASGVE
jgi:type III pantothenate kinase